MSSFGLGGNYGEQRGEQRSVTEGPLSSSTGTIRGQTQNLLRDLLLGAAPGAASLAGQPFQSVAPTPLNELGLFAGQQQGFNEAVKQAVGRLSGNFAGRGFLRPEAIGAIAGSAVQNVLPQFAPLMGQQIMGQDQFRQQLALAPEQVRSQRQTELLNFLSALAQSLGQQATSFGGQRGFQLGVGEGFGQGAGQAAGGAVLACWIAEALYGVTDLRVALLRLWFVLKLWETWHGRIALTVYRCCGPWIAKRIPGSPWLQAVCRLVFDRLVMRAEQWFDAMRSTWQTVA